MPKRITKNMKKWKIYEKSMDSFVRNACSSKWAPVFSRVDLARQGNWITATNSFPECETFASSAFHSNRCATKTTNAMIRKLCNYPRTGSDTLSNYDTKLDHREYAIRFVTEWKQQSGPAPPDHTESPPDHTSNKIDFGIWVEQDSENLPKSLESSVRSTCSYTKL